MRQTTGQATGRARGARLRCGFVWILAAAFTLGAVPVIAAQKRPPESTTVVVEGEAPANAANARELAIAAALRNAVAKAVGTYVDATTVGSNYQVVRSEIITKASGFAVTESVESQAVRGGILTVRVKATVSARPLAERLRELGLLHDWKIGVLARARGSSDRSSLDMAISRQLVEAGYRVIDAARRKQLAASETAVRAARGDRSALAVVSREFGVDILVVVDALVENVDQSMEGGVSFYRSRGAADARAYYADTGEVLAITDATAETLDQSTSLSARQCLGKIGSRIGAAFADDLLIAPAVQTSFVVLRVTNLKKMSSVSELEKTLKYIPGVTRVTRQCYANSTLELNVHINAEFRDQLPSRLESSRLGRKIKLRTDTWTRTYLQARAG